MPAFLCLHVSPGSSPRARGTGFHPTCATATERFIPASAGNRANHSRKALTYPVHPRERGEQLIGGKVAMAGAGSSPRARGTATNRSFMPLNSRFIPASAGNSALTKTPAITTTVHPRERGEQPLAMDRRIHDNGSSPRARGTAFQSLVVFTPKRFIPASAGNRCSAFQGSWCSSVHPRERGEQAP